jgi:hypothetical protein
MKSILELYNEGSEFAPSNNARQTLQMPGAFRENSYHFTDSDATQISSGVEVNLDDPGYSISGDNAPNITSRFTIPGKGGELPEIFKLKGPTTLSTYEKNIFNTNFYSRGNRYEANVVRESEQNQTGFVFEPLNN